MKIHFNWKLVLLGLAPLAACDSGLVGSYRNSIPIFESVDQEYAPDVDAPAVMIAEEAGAPDDDFNQFVKLLTDDSLTVDSRAGDELVASLQTQLDSVEDNGEVRTISFTYPGNGQTLVINDALNNFDLGESKKISKSEAISQFWKVLLSEFLSPELKRGAAIQLALSQYPSKDETSVHHESKFEFNDERGVNVSIQLNSYGVQLKVSTRLSKKAAGFEDNNSLE